MDAVRAAELAASRAQQRAGVEVRAIQDVADLRAASDVFQGIWGKRDDLGPPVNTDLLRAFAHAGNYVTAAFDGDGMLGALVGFLGTHEGELHLHSHILGVVPGRQARGVGLALKLHQRWWAMERDLGFVQWTFDPLVRRNGYFNLTKLGGQIDRYLVNFYGVMNDTQNRQEESDRILLRWDVGSSRTLAAAAGEVPDPLAGLDGEPPARLLSEDPDGNPVVKARGDGGVAVLLQVPADIVRMRSESPAQARRWREALREAMTTILGAGYRCEGMTREGEYVLKPRERATIPEL